MSDASYLRAAQEAFPDPQRAHATLAPLYVPPEEHETMRKAWEAFPVFMPPRLAKTEAPELPPPLEPVALLPVSSLLSPHPTATHAKSRRARAGTSRS